MNQTTLPHYIGITGFTQRSQIEWVLAQVELEHRTLMAGVLLSDKTLQGIPNKYPERYPVPTTIPDIWCPGAFNVLHYHSQDPTLPQLEQILTRCGVRAGMGMQLNVVWPAPARLAELVRRGIITILQVNQAALDQVNNDVIQLVDRLQTYPGLGYVLLDLSGGRGITLDPLAMVPYLEALLSHWRVVLAGGLGPDTVLGLRLLDNYQFSIDAESKLRDPADRLLLDVSTQYIQTALTVLR